MVLHRTTKPLKEPFENLFSSVWTHSRAALMLRSSSLSCLFSCFRLFISPAATQNPGSETWRAERWMDGWRRGGVGTPYPAEWCAGCSGSARTQIPAASSWPPPESRCSGRTAPPSACTGTHGWPVSKETLASFHIQVLNAAPTSNSPTEPDDVTSESRGDAFYQTFWAFAAALGPGRRVVGGDVSTLLNR